jgi:hypothetical protein
MAANDDKWECMCYRQCCCQETAAEVGVLREALQAAESFDGVMAYIDKTYPPAVFDGSSGDAGPRIIVLMRENARLREALQAAKAEREAALDEVAYLNAALQDEVEGLRCNYCSGRGACDPAFVDHDREEMERLPGPHNYELLGLKISPGQSESTWAAGGVIRKGDAPTVGEGGIVASENTRLREALTALLAATKAVSDCWHFGKDYEMAEPIEALDAARAAAAAVVERPQ